MSLRAQIFLFALYSSFSVAVVLNLGHFMPGLTQIESFIFGGLALLGGAFLHECLNRQTRERKCGELLLSLREVQSQQVEELANLKQAVAALETSGRSSADSEQKVDAVVAEVRVLQSLIEQLSQARDTKRRVNSPPFAANLSASELLGDEPQAKESALEEGKKEKKPAEKEPTKQPCSSSKRADVSLPPHLPLSQTSGRDRADLEAQKQGGRESEDAEAPGTEGHETTLGEDEILEIAQEALREDRIDLVLQPIVTLPQRRRRYYECFSRLRTHEGTIVRPEHYISIAEEAGFITAIDNMLLFRCVQLLRRVRGKEEQLDFFCNISRHTVTDDSFFGDFLNFLESDRELAPRLVFEFSQQNYENWPVRVAPFLERLRALGCRFSLDQVQHLAIDPESMAASGFKYLKLPADMILKELEPESDLLRRCREAGLHTIAEKVETEDVMRELLDYDLDLAQGYLFSEPRLARPAA